MLAHLRNPQWRRETRRFWGAKYLGSALMNVVVNTPSTLTPPNTGPQGVLVLSMVQAQSATPSPPRLHKVLTRRPQMNATLSPVTTGMPNLITKRVSLMSMLLLGHTYVLARQVRPANQPPLTFTYPPATSGRIQPTHDRSRVDRIQGQDLSGS